NNAKIDWILTDNHSLQFEGGVTTTDNLRTEKSGSPMDMDNKRVHYGLTHDWKWGSNANTKSYVLTEDVNIVNSTNESEYKSTILNTRTVMPFKSHVLSVGAEYKKEETLHDADRFPGSKALDLSRWQAALFAEDEYYLT